MKKNAAAVPNSMTPKEPMSKEQKKVTDWLRRNIPTKKTKFLSAHVVEYFIGSKAVDGLLNDSPWAAPKDKTAAPASASAGGPLVFHSRDQAIAYMDDLLRHKQFHRAKKIPVLDTKKEKKGKKEAKTDTSEVEATPKAGDGDQKKKRKIRLDMHLEQLFVDNNDAFVWLYDPISWVYWLGGTAIVLGTIAICMFPLWPPMMRQGVHYLSMGAAGFLLLIMGIAIFKYILFGALFVLSGGKLNFWLFPNLTEDVGFFESFVPLYDYTYTGPKKSKKGKKGKAKDSDDEESDDSEDEEESGAEGEAEAAEAAEKTGKKQSDSEDSTSKKSSSTGKDFEMVDKNEDTADEES